MKKIYILLVISVIFLLACTNKKEQPELLNLDKELTNISQENNELLNLSFLDLLTNISWLLGYNSGDARDELKFNYDNTYSLTDFYGLGEYALGKYEIMNESEIILHYPTKFPRDFTDVVSYKLKNLFINNNGLQLKLDRKYRDFYNLGKLYSDNVFFVSNLVSPSNEEYKIDNATAIKTAGFIKILNNINMRSEPSVNSALVKIDLANRARVDSNYLIDSRSVISLVFPEEIYQYEAKSKNIDEIDGISKQWYRIIMQNEFNVTYAWVFGGYVEEVSGWNSDPHIEMELQINIAKELVSRGLATENYIEDTINRYF